MAKKVIKLSEEQLVQNIQDAISENLAYKLDARSYETVCLNEMATMNSNDTSGAIPYNRCFVEIWPNDHLPKHIHVKKTGEYELTFSIETGGYLDTKYSSGKVNIPTITKMVRQWLSQQSSVEGAKGLTNQQVCTLQWNIYHPKK